MSTAVKEAAPSGPEIEGYLDAVTGDWVHGWAWDRSRPEARLQIELRLDEETIGTVVADEEREDLRANGIGDGKHAFRFRLTPEMKQRSGQIHVLARAATGDGFFPLSTAPAPSPPGQAGGQPGQAPEAIDKLLHSHRLLHRATQSTLTAVRELADRPPAGEELRAVQDALQRQIASFEVFVMRLDGTLQELNQTTKMLRERSPDRTLLVLMAILAALTAASFAFSLIRAFL